MPKGSPFWLSCRAPCGTVVCNLKDLWRSRSSRGRCLNERACMIEPLQERTDGPNRFGCAGSSFSRGEGDLRKRPSWKARKRAEGHGAPSRDAKELSQLLRQRRAFARPQAILIDLHPSVTYKCMPLLHATPCRLIQAGRPYRGGLGGPEGGRLFTVQPEGADGSYVCREADAFSARDHRR